MSQVIWVIQANMAQTNPEANDYVSGQSVAQATASANAATIVTNAISALSLGTASTHAAGDFATPASVSAKFAQPVGTTLQFLRGDGSLATSPVLSTVATSGAYSDLTGKPTLGSAAALASSAFDAAGAASSAVAALCSGTTLQFLRGDGTLATFSTAAISAVTWSTLTGKPTFANVATSGLYSDLTGTPSLGTQMSVDTGWTANTYGGVKAAVLVTYSLVISGAMVTALNLTSAGLGTSLVTMDQTLQLLVQQVAGLRTALIAAKLPNV